MDIIIEARALAAKSGGVKTYTYELIKNLQELHPEALMELIYGSRAIGTFPSTTQQVIPLRSELLLPWWLSGPVAQYVETRKPSVVHYTKAAITKYSRIPTVVTIYDIIPILMPQTQSPLRRMYWPRVLRTAADRADHIMTISQRSKRDIIEHFRIAEEKVTVTPLAVDLAHFKPGSRIPRGKPYVLFVGTRDERKNIVSLIRAFAQIADRIPHQLIIAGRPAKKQDNSVATAKEFGLVDRVEFREHVSYQELPALYAGADIFVWPSLYEGWGFPPQEAMACGTPVIVSDGGPLPEVVGDAGITVPLGSNFVDQLADEMLTLISDEARRKELSTKGLARVQQFSWKDVAEKTWDVYQKVAV